MHGTGLAAALGRGHPIVHGTVARVRNLNARGALCLGAAILMKSLS